MTDYALYSEYIANINSQLVKPASVAASKARVREMLAGLSGLIEEQTGRRFDHRLESVYHCTRRIGKADGRVDPDESNILILRGDLISVSEVLNNETEIVSPSDYDLYPAEPSAKYISEIHLAEGMSWGWINKPRKGAKITGVWGWGGRWLNKTTLSAGIDASVTAIPVTAFAGLEMRQIIRVDSEYMMISADVTATPITCERAVNGSVAASHLNGATVAVFQPDPLVKRLVLGLAKWQSELDDNPLIAEVTVGDATETVNLDRAPTWARDMLELLTRSQDIGFA